MAAETKKAQTTKQQSKAKAKAAVPPPEPEVIHIYADGDRVTHRQFGDGQVTAVRDDKLTIEFEKAGTKVVVDDFVKRRR